ncbi:MAG TPA: response regulator [Coleofasciculaceae cyanobacterium]
MHVAQTEAPDAILLDISMPNIDGFQVCKELQANPATQKVPVIMLTAKVLRSDRNQFADPNITGIKPFEPMTIERQVAEILDWKIEE